MKRYCPFCRRDTDCGVFNYDAAIIGDESYSVICHECLAKGPVESTTEGALREWRLAKPHLTPALKKLCELAPGLWVAEKRECDLWDIVFLPRSPGSNTEAAILKYIAGRGEKDNPDFRVQKYIPESVVRKILEDAE